MERRVEGGGWGRKRNGDKGVRAKVRTKIKKERKKKGTSRKKDGTAAHGGNKENRGDCIVESIVCVRTVVHLYRVV